MRSNIAVPVLIVLLAAIAAVADECHIICADVKRSINAKSACSAFRNSLPRPKVSPRPTMHIRYMRTQRFAPLAAWAGCLVYIQRTTNFENLVYMHKQHDFCDNLRCCTPRRYRATVRMRSRKPSIRTATTRVSTMAKFPLFMPRVDWIKSVIAP